MRCPRLLRLVRPFCLLVLLLGMSVPGSGLRAQVSEVELPSGSLSAEEQSAYRQAWIESLNREAGLGSPRRFVSTVSPSWGTAVAWDRFQLSVVDPAYVPFQIVPPRSPLSGLFSEWQYGGSSMHLGSDSHVMVFPNDPLQGWGRRGVGMVGTVFPGAGFLPNYWLMPGAGLGVW